MGSATFVLSTGRCGTQWLTEFLANSYPQRLVCHEPLHFDYRPDLNTELSPVTVNRDIITTHLLHIQRLLDEGKEYIETGFPCWRHIQWFRQQLKGQVRVIHLHREPQQTVASLLKINAFVPPILPHLPTKNLYLPDSATGLLAELRHLWPQLNAAEKNLWYWTEVQALALQWQTEWPSEDWLALGFTELFSPEGSQKLQCFLGKEDYRKCATPAVVDHYGLAAIAYGPLVFPRLQQLPTITALAHQLGYSFQS